MTEKKTVFFRRNMYIFLPEGQAISQLDLRDDRFVGVGLNEEPAPHSLQGPVGTAPPTVVHAVLRVVEVGVPPLHSLPSHLARGQRTRPRASTLRRQTQFGHGGLVKNQLEHSNNKRTATKA